MVSKTGNRPMRRVIFKYLERQAFEPTQNQRPRQQLGLPPRRTKTDRRPMLLTCSRPSSSAIRCLAPRRIHWSRAISNWGAFSASIRPVTFNRTAFSLFRRFNIHIARCRGPSLQKPASRLQACAQRNRDPPAEQVRFTQTSTTLGLMTAGRGPRFSGSKPLSDRELGELRSRSPVQRSATRWVLLPGRRGDIVQETLTPFSDRHWGWQDPESGGDRRLHPHGICRNVISSSAGEICVMSRYRRWCRIFRPAVQAETDVI